MQRSHPGVGIGGKRNCDLRVKDDGIGIPKDMLTRVFDMFTQVDRTKERMEGGLGIGLTLAYRLVLLHGGEIEAQSQGEGCGSEFIVRLPRLETGDATPDSLLAPERTSGAPLRILVVDDNVDAAESMALFLEQRPRRGPGAHGWPPSPKRRRFARTSSCRYTSLRYWPRRRRSARNAATTSLSSRSPVGGGRGPPSLREAGNTI
jgi:hypothetical protein